MAGQPESLVEDVITTSLLGGRGTTVTLVRALPRSGPRPRSDTFAQLRPFSHSRAAELYRRRRRRRRRRNFADSTRQLTTL